ncbi:MAG TPA: Calx-beta domain-containing protein, partial [Acidimicrobiales bacterium]
APNDRLYFAGAGGTVYFRDNLDGAQPAATGQLAFFGRSNYDANPASFDSTVFINTPITADTAGNIYFGFRTNGTAPLGLKSGIARIAADGAGTWVTAAGASGGDPDISRVPHQAAPALSHDEHTLYVVVAGAGTTSQYLVGLDPTTLGLKESSPGTKMRVALKDPRHGGTNNALVLDDSSASPMVGPDGDVYYGVLGNPFNGSRGWLLHFSGDLTQTKTPGAFGWDNTAAIVPRSAVPSYAGSSSYLIFTKYNNYAGLDGGDGVNKIAVLDPNDTMAEPHASSNGLPVMKEVLTIAGPTPDKDFFPQFPNAVREWCINTAAVDPATRSVMANSEDGKLYRWDLTTNTLSFVTLSPGIGEAYTPTLIGPDGTVYAINQAVLNAIGRRPAIAINDVSVAEGTGGTTPAVFTVSLSSASTEAVSVAYASADGSATAGSDYTAVSGSLTFAPGETTKSITVLVKGDTVIEPDEAFFVNLSSPTNATIARGRGQGTILNDDSTLPALSINDV